MNYLKKVILYLEALKFKSNPLKFNPNTFSWENIESLENNATVEFILPEETMQLILYQKYIRVKKEPKNKYDNLFYPTEYEWQLVMTFCSKFLHEVYETKTEKLVATPYIAITEEQYQDLLSSERKKRGQRKR